MSQMMLMNPLEFDNPPGRPKGSNTWKSIIKRDIDILQSWNVSIPSDVLLLPDNEQKHIKLSVLIAGKSTEKSTSNTLTISEVKGTKQQALIKGIVSLTPVKTDPADINDVALVKQNPLMNPLTDNIVMSSIAGIGNSMGIYWLSGEAEKKILAMMTEKKVNDAALYSKALGIGVGSAVVGLEVAAIKFFDLRADEEESYKRLAIYSGLAGLAVPTLDFLKQLYNKFVSKSNPSNTNNNVAIDTSTVFMEWLPAGSEKEYLLYKLSATGEKLYLDENYQTQLSGYPRHKPLNLPKKQEPMRRQIAGYPSVQSQKMPWWNGN